jgi:hypothetical protein
MIVAVLFLVMIDMVVFVDLGRGLVSMLMPGTFVAMLMFMGVLK